MHCCSSRNNEEESIASWIGSCSVRAGLESAPGVMFAMRKHHSGGSSMRGSIIDNLKRLDESRPSFPGEHWLALAAGLWLLRRSGGSVVSKALGAVLLYRAASGRDGLRRLWQDERGRVSRSDGGASAERMLESSVSLQTRAGGYPDFR